MSSLNKKSEITLTKFSNAIGNVSKKIVSCKGCTKCCEQGIVFVLPSEVDRLKKLGVQTHKIDGIHFIKRQPDGSCSMLDKTNNLCKIYKNRPFCCKAFPLDIFSRNDKLEWSLYTCCPSNKIRRDMINQDTGEIDFEILGYIIARLEKLLDKNLLQYFEIEDKVSFKLEILDQINNNYKIVSPVIK